MFMRIFLLVVLLLVCPLAEAYIGPGAGISFLGSLWTLLVGIVLALAAILTWPIRLLLRRMRNKPKPGVQKTTDDIAGE
jgi:membrane protein implicated in regulation of membrane protease activity